MQRVVVGRSFTLSQTFYEDGVATAPTGTPTVSITRDDGTLVTHSAVTVDETTASVTVPASENTLLDSLTVTWTATIAGEPQVYEDTVEVAGGFLFSIAQALATSGLGGKTEEDIRGVRTLVETALEQACGVAFVPRYSRMFVSGNGLSTYLLPPRVTAIRSLKVDGVAATDVDTMLVLPSGELYYPTGFTRGFSNYEIAFEHGHPYPPPRVSAAALLWAKTILVSGPMDDRALTYSTEDASYTMAVPGMRGSVSGIPEVDATIAAYSLNVAVA